MQAWEVNFDGLVGMTHSYSALSYGNIASTASGQDLSYPKTAALQGLAKMKALHDQGFKQAVLPPQERPHLSTLKKLGFTGSPETIIQNASISIPNTFLSCSSSSAMWTANAATISPSADTQDKKVHVTPANLVSKFHRAIETPVTSRILKAIFTDSKHFIHHEALPDSDYFGDEGAANHTRFCQNYHHQGVELFVYGRYAFQPNQTQTTFPARQTFEASQTIGRLHQLSPDFTIYAQQNPEMINAGVFHNDVISVGNQNVFLYHENAFINTPKVIQEIIEKYPHEDFYPIMLENKNVPLKDVIYSYLFNSQLVSIDNQKMKLISPMECQTTPSIYNWIQSVIAADNPIDEVEFFDVKQSMKNGGGPACLRLRVVLNNTELNAINQSVILTEELYQTLTDWVHQYYPETLTQEDLYNPKLYDKNCLALDALTHILNLGKVYDFQRETL